MTITATSTLNDSRRPLGDILKSMKKKSLVKTCWWVIDVQVGEFWLMGKWMMVSFDWMGKWVMVSFGWMGKWVMVSFGWMGKWVMVSLGWMGKWVMMSFGWMGKWVMVSLGWMSTQEKQETTRRVILKARENYNAV